MTYTLQNDQCRAAFNSKGAELTSLQDTATGLEYLWQADPAHWNRHAPLLFPIVGRLPDDTYLVNGRTYKLPQHGFARDQAFQLIEQSPDSLTFQLLSNPDTLAVYPFVFDLRVRYTLVGRTLTVGWQVRNPDAANELLFSIGGHPAFNCPLGPGGRFDDYAFHFDQPVTVRRHLIRGGLRTGETAPVLENQRTLPLTYELFADDALVFKHFDFDRIALQRLDGTGPRVRMAFAGFPDLGLWTKPGAPFVCIEPWHGVASALGAPQELREKEGIIALKPGQEFATSYEISI